MTFQHHTPSGPLNKFVEGIYYVEGNNKGTGLPKMGMSVVFNLDDHFKLYTDERFTKFTLYKKFWVSGFQQQPRYVENYGSSKMLVIQFKILGAHPFLYQPLHYFTGSFENLENVFPAQASKIWERLVEAETISEKFLIVEDFLLNRLLMSKTNGSLVPELLSMLVAHNTIPRINEVCQEKGISRKHLNELFKEQIGVSPKVFSALHRFQKVLKQLTKSRPLKLSDIAYQFGYYDQAHFCNDFKRFSGMNPSEYVMLVEKVPSLSYAPHFIPSKFR